LIQKPFDAFGAISPTIRRRRPFPSLTGRNASTGKEDSWLSAQAGKRYRLLSEAEWEYAARSGGKEETWSGTSLQEELGAYAWYDTNSGPKTQSVGGKKPNGLGLYDMTHYNIRFAESGIAALAG